MTDTFNIKEAMLGVLIKHDGVIIVLQRPEELRNICVTFLAHHLGVNPFELDKAVTMVADRLKQVKPIVPAKPVRKDANGVSKPAKKRV